MILKLKILVQRIKSIYRFIVSEIAYLKRIKNGLESLDDFKLIMTLMVKDEEDIISTCIEHHLDQGVDYIYAADDGSTDNTANILRKYEQKGLLQYTLISNERWDQSKTVNYLGKMAHSNFNNAIIFHCDADELWVSATGNLKQELSEHPKITGLYIPVINVLLRDNNGLERFPQDAVNHVVNPKEYKSSEKKHINDFFLQKYHDKVMYNLNNGYINVTAGNHDIIPNSKKVVMAKSRNIKIYHFPVRNRDQFYNKVVKAKYAITDNKNIQGETAWHWRKWVEDLNSGNFDQSYKNVIVSIDESKKLIEKKIIKEIDFNEIFSS